MKGMPMTEALHSLLSNASITDAVGALAFAVFSAFKASDWYQGRKNLATRAVLTIADKAVSGVWHDFLREVTDESKAQGVPVPKGAEMEAHERAVDTILSAAQGAGLSAHPLISEPSAINSLVVQRVKAFKAGRGLDTPTSKGGF